MIFAALGYHLAVLDQGRGIPGEFVVGAGHAHGHSRVGGARDPYVHHAGIVADGFVALGHYAHVARAGNIRVHDFGGHIVFNKVMAAGAAKGNGAVGADGSTDTDAEDIPAGSRVGAQVAHVYEIVFSCGSYVQVAAVVLGKGDARHGVVLDTVHAHSHHAGQGG